MAEPQKRVMTSAISGLPVSGVRKALLEVRTMYQSNTPAHPMYMTDTLSCGQPIQNFCLDFVRGHSDKRHNKGKPAAAAAANANEHQSQQ